MNELAEVGDEELFDLEIPAASFPRLKPLKKIKTKAWQSQQVMPRACKDNVMNRPGLKIDYLSSLIVPLKMSHPPRSQWAAKCFSEWGWCHWSGIQSSCSIQTQGWTKTINGAIESSLWASPILGSRAPRLFSRHYALLDQKVLHV